MRIRILGLVALQAVLGAPSLLAGTMPTGTAFTYQGLLKSGGAVVDQEIDLRCRLYGTENGPPQVAEEVELLAVPVSGGVFTVDLDFGAVFGTSERWLEIDVKLSTQAPMAYETLSPRQRINAAPISSFSLATGSTPDSAFQGTYTQAVNLTNPANTYAGSGALLGGLNAFNIATGTLSASHLPASGIWDIATMHIDATESRPLPYHKASMHIETDHGLHLDDFDGAIVGGGLALINAGDGIRFAYQGVQGVEAPVGTSPGHLRLAAFGLPLFRPAARHRTAATSTGTTFAMTVASGRHATRAGALRYQLVSRIWEGRLETASLMVSSTSLIETTP